MGRRNGHCEQVWNKELTSPSSSLQPPKSHHHHSSSNVSSIYSQPSPDLRNDVPRLTIPRSSSIYPEDVSPPDTPRSFDDRRSHESSPNVSPIIDSKPISQHIPPLRKITPSRIPEPRLAPAPLAVRMNAAGNGGLTQPNATDKVPKKGTRWDAFSGEPTQSQLGKPPQVIPGTRAFSPSPVNSDSDGPMGNSVRVTAGTQPKSFLADRLRKVPRRDPNQPLPEREPWKGASGRSAIIRALVDKPLPPGKEPIFQPNPNAPRNPERPRAASITKQPPPHKPIVIAQPNSPRSIPPRVASRASPPDLTIKPVVPLKAGTNSPHSPLVRTALSQLEKSPSGNGDMRSPLARNPSADLDMSISTPKNAFTDVTPVQSPEDAKRDEKKDGLGASIADMKLTDEPSSRFSVTTYNTTMQESPPQTPQTSAEPPPPLPTPPSPVLNRKRPVPTSGVSLPRGTNRKPTPSEATNSGAKSLPVLPPAEVVDRVASLSAKIEALTRRRAELQTMIHELTQVVQPSSIKYDMASRQEIKKTVARLEAETATVTKDIHETGMKLHRAQKRRDEDSLYEPTGLWVRRVTE